jgi:hypothetical protein
MDGVRDFLDDVAEHGYSKGQFLGLLNVLIGRRITRADGTILSNGVTWREAATALRKARWNKDVVRELNLDPAALPPRDRERFWYFAIAHANVGSDGATEAGNRFAEKLRAVGYTISPPPQSK